MVNAEGFLNEDEQADLVKGIKGGIDLQMIVRGNGAGRMVLEKLVDDLIFFAGRMLGYGLAFLSGCHQRRELEAFEFRQPGTGQFGFHQGEMVKPLGRRDLLVVAVDHLPAEVLVHPGDALFTDQGQVGPDHRLEKIVFEKNTRLGNGGLIVSNSCSISTGLMFLPLARTRISFLRPVMNSRPRSSR
jgi:hypothetical protein